MDWKWLINTVGLPGTMFLGLLYVLIWHVIPAYDKHLTKSRELLEKQLDLAIARGEKSSDRVEYLTTEFLNSLHKLDQNFAETAKHIVLMGDSVVTRLDERTLPSHRRGNRK